MAVDPVVQKFIDVWAAQPALPLDKKTIAEIRQGTVDDTATLGPAEAIGSTENLQITGPTGEPLLLRSFTPVDQQIAATMVFFHGGGWVTGTLDTHDAMCRSLANATGVSVVAVDYRRAPEHRYPAAAEDAYVATNWVMNNASQFGGNANQVIVCGDSAGANLATAVCLMAKERQTTQPAGQVLIYPATDHQCETESYETNATGYLLSRSDMQWFWQQYLGDAERGTEPFASPLLAPDLSGLAPALVLTAEYDPLRDDGTRYADRLKEAGVPINCIDYAGMVHGFVRRTNQFAQAKQAVSDIATAAQGWVA